jgi:catechol 2,3-dioxygenase-like lactoylglutathione lyase family enzyme
MKKTVLILFCFLTFSFLQAQETVSIALNFNHAALSVKNLDQSVVFYKNVLKLQEITNRTKKEGIHWFSIGDGKELHLVSTIKDPVMINKAVHISFSVAESDFETVIANLNSQKISYSSWTGELNKITIRADGIKQIYFQDPDGYWIEINSAGQNNEESEAIIKLLEKESATWRSGDSEAHASCWHIQPYSKILISTADGQTLDIPAQDIIKPISNPSGGSSANTNYKMSIHGDTAWVSHDEVSTAKDGKKNLSHEIRMLEKINGEWKLVGQSIHSYKVN